MFSLVLSFILSFGLHTMDIGTGPVGSPPAASPADIGSGPTGSASDLPKHHVHALDIGSGPTG